jgi:hypothetical protein
VRILGLASGLVVLRPDRLHQGLCSVSISIKSNGDWIWPFAAARDQFLMMSPGLSPALSPAEFLRTDSTYTPWFRHSGSTPIVRLLAANARRTNHNLMAPAYNPPQ